MANDQVEWEAYFSKSQGATSNKSTKVGVGKLFELTDHLIHNLNHVDQK